MTDTADRTTAPSALSRHQLDRLIRRLKERGPAERRAEETLPRRPPGAPPAPLSPDQERLWFLHTLDPGSAAYNLAASVRLRGRLDRVALARALRGVVRRHESLRTRIETDDRDEPVQRLLPVAEVARLPWIDLGSLPPERAASEARRLAAAHARRPFDLSRGPLLRTALVARDVERGGADGAATPLHELLLSVHHVVADGGSISLFYRELQELSRRRPEGPAPGQSPGQSPEAAPLPVRYGDFAAWKRERLRSGAYDDSLAYWRERLAGAPVAELAADRGRPAEPSGRGACVPFALDGDLAAGLRTLARSAEATPFMVVLAAFYLLLARWSGETDLVVGSVVAGRERPELASMIGFFANTLALRTRTEEAASFRELLEAARRTVVEALEHQGVPFAGLVHDAAGRGVSGDGNPFFRVLLSMETRAEGPLELAGLDGPVRGEAEEVHSGTAKFDLSLLLQDSSRSLGGVLEYATDLFDRTTALRAAGHLRTILREAIDRPEAPLGELAWLTPPERQQVVEWNAAAEGPAAEPALLHERFEAHARSRPDAVAVASGHRVWTYGELARRARLLADRLVGGLRRRGVGPETLVGLCARRSPEMVAGILGILEAGAGYLPLDPKAPSERLAFMIRDSKAPVVLVEPGLESALPALEARGVRTLRLEAAPTGAEPEPMRGVPADPRNLAYVIYTSGSTGVPKASWISHANVGGLLEATERWLAAGPDDTWTLFHSYAFDFSVWELWGALAYGGRLEVVSHWASRSPGSFRDLLRRRRVTVLNQTPSAFKQLVSAEVAAPERALTDLRFVIFGGEALEPTALAPWIDLHGDRRPRLVNMYGITETTVHVTHRPVTAADVRGAAGSPVGRPLPHLAVHLLDPWLRPVPLGVPGEIHVGGRGLARGYLDRPSLTAQRFVPDPFAAARGAAGERLYKAGDLARRLPGGGLDFVGRLDHQVKVRGFRVELGEIEAVLAAHPSVERVAVIARDEAGGDQHLAAYVVGREVSGVDAGELRLHCQERLPDYMVPSRWVELEELPLTSNGKLDREALPEPGAAPSRGPRRDRVPLRGSVEAAVASAYSEVLGTGAVGRDDDFFELGGHSLLATRLVARLRTLLGVEVPVRAVFEHPTVAGLAGQAAAVAGAGSGELPAEELSAAEKGRGVPLSFAQQRLWFLESLRPGAATYTLAGAYRLSGSLDLPALAGAFAAVVRRHEALRTVFREGAEGPVQVVLEPAGFPLPVIDLEGLPALLRAAAAARAARREATRPFDLARGPLARALALRAGPEEHLLVVALHHIVADGWSMGVLVREVAEAYGPLRSGRRPKAEPLALQYGDYAAWQRRWLAAGALESQLGFWRERLAGAVDLDLPTDRPRPSERSGRGRRARRRIVGALAAGLERRARAEEASLFMVLLAAFQAVLGRSVGQDDVSVGTPVANRTRTETEGLIGFFVNTLVLRGDLSGGPTVRELVARTREATLEAYAHQDVPFERVVEELAPWREMARTPLFQVMLILQNAPREPVVLPGLELEELELDTGTAKFDLTLDAREVGDGLALVAEYDADLFDATTVERLLERYLRVLAAVAERPETPVAELPLLGPAERHQLLVEWNERGGRAGPSGSLVSPVSLTELFEGRAAACPEAVAVVSRGRAVTYGELERRSRALAGRLAAGGIGPGRRVGVCLERSPDLVAALLGVLRAGAAYVPLDPAYPPERLAFMLEDSAAGRVVTSEELLPRLPEALAGGGAEPLLVPAALSEGEPAAGPPPPPGPGELAYLIYTSGSTGRPKGVAIEHRSAAARVAWALGAFGPDELDGVLASTSVCFDLSVFELFVPLAAGGRVVLVADALDLVGHPEAERVTLVNTVPSAMAELLRLDAVPSSVRGVNLAGEPLKSSLVDRIYAATRAERVLDLYGPSEDTTYSTGGLALPAAGREPFIGRPLEGTRAYALDADGRPAPLGAPGELLLGGAGLSRGYHARPGLTAARYLPDPFSGEAGDRLYRTGDLVRHLPDGRLDFLGRIDHQVKLRGFRIELGEVEAALTGHPAVEDCAALVRGEGAEARLVAFVELAAGKSPGAPGADELRAHVRERLPAPMVPARVQVLDALPRTPNGKTDRRALAALELAAPEAGRERLPESELERAVARAFQEILDLPSVGAEDDFFELGGHSLLATRLVSRLRRTLALELRPRQVFELRTVRALAAALAGAAHEALPPLLPRDRGREWATGLPPSFAQERLWFLDRFEPGSAQYAIPGGLRLLGELRAAALARALEAIVARHETLRTRFEERDGVARVRVQAAASSALPLPVVDLAALPPSAREAGLGRVSRQQAEAPFDLARAPLLRGTLARLAPREHVLVVVMHHIVSDGWSLRALSRELTALYEALCKPGRAGRDAELAAALPALTVQYPDYALWQRRALSEEIRARELEYWRGRLADLPSLELPGDRPRPPVRSGRGASLPARLPPPLARAAEAFGRGRDASPFHVLMAAFEAVLARWSGQEDFGVGTPVANRSHPEVEGLVGLFVNTVVLRARPEAGLGFGELVERVRDASIGALNHQELPLELVVEALAPDRDPSRTPLFQVVLGFFNEPAVFELPGLRVEAFDIATGTSKFDVTVNLRPEGEAISGTLEVSADLFDAATGGRLWRHLSNLLESALADADRPLGELPLLSRAERHQATVEWAGAPSAYPREVPLEELFAYQARTRPDAVAVEQGGRSLTYGELARRSGRLAADLRRRGVGPDVAVGLLLERSLEMIVATLGVILAGGAYAPLDPEYPRERLERMLGETKAPVILAHRHLAAGFPGLLGREGDGGGSGDGAVDDGAPEVIELNRDAGVGADEARAAGGAVPGPAADPGNLAYVMYTSGSTGRPKGVAVPRRAVARLVLEADFARLDAAETFLQLAPTPFDAATLEIWGPLLNGGRLVVMPPGPVGFGELGRVLETRRISTLWLTAGFFQRMVEEELPALAGVRQLLAGGDVLSPRHVRRVLEELPGVRVINGYGPTENTTFTACFPMGSARQAASPVPIGRPIADSTVALVDRRSEAVPAGVPGELHAAGDGLARGYLGRPATTAAVFVPHPRSPAPGARAYRTGDLARWRPEGTLEFLGRLDGQVKLRGFRIELGEVASVLAEHPDVEEAVVVARPDAGGEKRLVGYAVAGGAGQGAAPSPEALRAYLVGRLPAFMVPQDLVLLDALPLDPNGKVDRRALPEPVAAAPAEGAEAEPRTAAEELVAEVFGEVLQVGSVPLDAGFFDLGGNSLQAARVASRLRAALGRDVPLRWVFERPTVRELASVLGGLEATSGPPLERLADEAARRAGLPLSFAQERLWFLDRYEPASAQYAIPGGLRLAGGLRPAALARTLAAIVDRHEALRTRFEEQGGEARQRVEPAVPVSLPVVDLSALPAAAREADLARLGRAVASAPFDLERAPLLRAALARLGPDDHALVVVMHHIVSDGWSLTVLSRELTAFYGAMDRDRTDGADGVERRAADQGGELPAGLSELPVQYPDYALWQRKTLTEEVRTAELEAWRELLAGLPVLELPGDRPRPPVRSGRGRTLRVALPPPLVRAAEAFGRARDASPFHVLMAAFQAALGRWSGQEDFGVGTPVANRNHREIEGLVGFFVNTLVLRARPEAGLGFGGLVARVRRGAVEALGRREMPLELLVEALAPERDPSRTPLFQVMLGFLNEPAAFELPGLRVEPFDVVGDTAKLDLTVNLRPEGEGIAGALEVSSDLFDPATGARLWRHLSTLLEAALAAPERPLADLPLLSRAERQQAAVEWAGAPSPYLRDATLPELFARQVGWRSDAVAVELGERALTYGELARRAERVAVRLRGAGVGPGDVVGLCFERSPELLAAMLGALQAGAAYLPLDPSYPADRLAFMIEDSGAVGVMAAPDTVGALPEGTLVLAAATATAAGAGVGRDGRRREPEAWPPGPQDPADLIDPLDPRGTANVIYTSGSTGRPKGVLVTHRGVARLVDRTDHLQVRAGDRMSFGSNIAFDAATLEIWSALASGACLVGLGREELLDPRRLAAALAARRLSVAFFTTALFNQLARDAPGALGALRTVGFGGEAADPRAARAVLDAGGPERLLNLYGPAENATLSTWHRIGHRRIGHRIGRRLGDVGAGVPIGGPVANSTVHLLGAGMRHVPVGVP